MAGKVCLVLFMVVILFVNLEASDLAGSFLQSESISIDKTEICSVYIRTELPERQPVFISNDYKLKVPRSGYLFWKSNAFSWIACPTTENDKAERIKCIKGYLFESDSEGIFDIRNKTCRQMITGNVQLKEDEQGNITSRAIGFSVTFPDKVRFIELYHSYINETDGSVLYTHHILFGTEINHKCRYPRANIPSFKKDGFTDKLHPGTAYSTANTELILRTYPYPPGKSYDSGNHLQKGLRTPQGDQLFTTWQFSTYYYINVAGMWNSISTGNWKKVEDAVRSYASKNYKTLDIFTGTYGILELFPNSPELTLEKKWFNETETFKNISVPKLVWKIVKDSKANEAIALVVSNNPFVNAKRLCQSTETYGYGWHLEDYDNYQNGLVSICTVKDLKKIVDNIPKEAGAAKILKQ